MALPHAAQPGAPESQVLPTRGISVRCAYSLLGVVPSHVSPFYFALVNFTTLGYGDVLPVARWEILGPLP